MEGPQRWRAREVSDLDDFTSIRGQFNTARLEAREPDDMAMFARDHADGTTVYFSPMTAKHAQQMLVQVGGISVMETPPRRSDVRLVVPDPNRREDGGQIAAAWRLLD
jgi:hypothetical protein